MERRIDWSAIAEVVEVAGDDAFAVAAEVAEVVVVVVAVVIVAADRGVAD